MICEQLQNNDVIGIWITHIPHVSKNPFDNLPPNSRAVFQTLRHTLGTQHSYWSRCGCARWSALGQRNLTEHIFQIHKKPSLVFVYSRERVCICFALLTKCSIIIPPPPSLKPPSLCCDGSP